MLLRQSLCCAARCLAVQCSFLLLKERGGLLLVKEGSVHSEVSSGVIAYFGIGAKYSMHEC